MPYQDVNILIVEDQRPFLILLKGLLTNLGAKDVMTATSADQAIRFCRNHRVDIIVCDLHLGTNKKNGFELYQELQYRKMVSACAVFLLISADATRPIVLGSLEHKPDDYLLKPFALSELVARIEAILRRSSGGGRHRLEVGDLSYDLDTLQVSRAGKALKLNPPQRSRSSHFPLTVPRYCLES